jgi:DnaK suppressor protein
VSAVDTAYDDVVQRAATDLDEVDAALGRLAEGTYGTCAVCGEPIPDEELATLPTARACAGHAR